MMTCPVIDLLAMGLVHGQLSSLQLQKMVTFEVWDSFNGESLSVGVAME
jgi:hypothetical protein